MASPGPGGDETSARAFDDQLALKLSQRGEESEHQATVRGGRIDRGTLAGEDLEADFLTGQIMDEINQVAEVPAKPIKLPDDEGIVGTQTFQTGIETGPIILGAGRVVLVRVG
jgi:hypothetical protein